MNPRNPTPQVVRDFILSLYADKFKRSGMREVPDDFDLVTGGVIDSMGVIELVSALEQEFGMELDLSGMGAEELAVVGPLARYVSAQAARSGPTPAA